MPLKFHLYLKVKIHQFRSIGFKSQISGKLGSIATLKRKGGEGGIAYEIYCGAHKPKFALKSHGSMRSIMGHTSQSLHMVPIYIMIATCRSSKVHSTDTSKSSIIGDVRSLPKFLFVGKIKPH